MTIDACSGVGSDRILNTFRVRSGRAWQVIVAVRAGVRENLLSEEDSKITVKIVAEATHSLQSSETASFYGL